MHKTTPSFPKQLLRAANVIHFIIAAILASIVLYKHASLPTLAPTSFFTLLIYGYMGVWLYVFSYLLIVCGKQQKAIFLNRILVKFIMFLFPIPALLSLSKDGHLEYKELLVFITYVAIVAVILLVYELVTCLCFQDKHPDFLFEENDLVAANEQVWEKRKELTQNT